MELENKEDGNMGSIYKVQTVDIYEFTFKYKKLIIIILTQYILHLKFDKTTF